MKEESWITGKISSVKYRPSQLPSGGLEIPLILKFNFSKPITFLNMKKFLNKLYDYELSGEVNIEENEDEEEMSSMVVAEDQESVDEKTEEKMEDVSNPLA